MTCISCSEKAQCCRRFHEDGQCCGMGMTVVDPCVLHTPNYAAHEIDLKTRIEEIIGEVAEGVPA